MFFHNVRICDIVWHPEKESGLRFSAPSLLNSVMVLPMWFSLAQMYGAEHTVKVVFEDKE